MYELAVVGVSILMFVAAIDYVRHAWRRDTTPVPATWILMVTTMALSFWMYRESPNWSWTGNIGVVSALANTSIILVGVIATNVRDNTLRIAFDAMQKWCLAGGAGVVVLWYFTGYPLVAYILVQCIALTGYFATAKRLWNAKKSTEPIFVWVCVLSACVVAIYPAWVKNDLFSWIYLARALPSTALMIILIRRAQRRMRMEVELTTVNTCTNQEKKLPRYIKCFVTSDSEVLLDGYMDLNRQKQTAPAGFMTEIEELNALHTRVTKHIWDAQHATAGTSEERRIWYAVSEIKEQIATILPVTTEEGRSVRRFAVWAALKAEDRKRAQRLCQQYSNEPTADSDFRLQLETLMR